MNNIVKKLTSRKFWLAVVGFVTPLLVAFGYSEQTVTQASAIIMAGGTLIAYIVGEGLVDAAHTDDTQLISFIDEDEDGDEE